MKQSRTIIGLTLVSLAAISLPFFAFAQANTSNATLVRIFQLLNQLVNLILPFMMVLCFVYFFWGLAKYIFAAGDAEKAAEGKTIMIHGVIALFIGVSIYGIIAWLQVFFDANAPAVKLDIQTPGLIRGKVT